MDRFVSERQVIAVINDGEVVCITGRIAGSCLHSSRACRRCVLVGRSGSLIAIDGSIQTRQYQDKNGNNRTAFEIVANNINFAGPKNSNAGGGANYQNSAPSYQNAAPARPAAVEAAPSYSAGNADDFAVIDDSDDLPF